MYKLFIRALVVSAALVTIVWSANLYQAHYFAERMRAVIAKASPEHVDAAKTCLNNAETAFSLLTSPGGVRWILQDAVLRERVEQVLWNNVGFTGEAWVACPYLEPARRGSHW